MKILNFNWAALDLRGGVKYTIGVTIVIALSLVIEFSWMAVGMSALLAWLVNVPGPRRERLTNIVLFIVVGAALIGLVCASFMLVTLMNVNAAAMIFFFVLPYSLVWGMLDAEAGHVIANERIVAELIGVVLAGIAVSMRGGLARKFSPQH
jgi:hypothetical protein